MLKTVFKYLAPLSLVTVFASGANAFTVTGTIRDFSKTHPDFADNLAALDPGIVETMLGEDKKPIYAGGTAGTTRGQAAFDQWYRDVPGVNLSTKHDIELTDPDGNGIFTYSSNAFFPIDGELLGNEGRNHNYKFTYEINSEFQYNGGEVFDFSGDDDVWVFINGKLAIDLGGIHPRRGRSVRLDASAASLGIIPGNTYSLDIFFAERGGGGSNFNINTSIILKNTQPVPEPLTILGSATALGIGGLLKREHSKKQKKS